MKNAFLVITSIADDSNPTLNRIALEASCNNVPLVVVGDKKSPQNFDLKGCDFYSAQRQTDLDFSLAKILPFNHYARKNLGYLVAMAKGAEIILETDDDNLPMEGFWNERSRFVKAFLLNEKGWVNVFRYFTERTIWPRGFALDKIREQTPETESPVQVICPIQQGLIDGNPDVDAIFRLAFPLQVKFNKSENIAVGNDTICPFNSQNTTWFREAFRLMYLPSYCGFRMTDIWRSFVAQRVAWTCGWPVMFHQSTVFQKRNQHNLLADFQEEIPGYLQNIQIVETLQGLPLKNGIENIPENMILCYEKLVECGLVDIHEIALLKAWLKDIELINH